MASLRRHIVCGLTIAAFSFSCQVAGWAVTLPVQWSIEDGGNGHWYEIVSPPGGINWSDARVAAENSSFMGTPGHLATITSLAEWEFLSSIPPSAYVWIGLSDAAQEGSFQWVTGEPLEYTIWKRNEPNNAGDEDHVHYDGGGWNDFHNRATVYGDPHSYAVEYPVPQPTTLAPTAIDPTTADDVLDSGAGIKAITGLNRDEPGTLGILNHPGEPDGKLDLWFILQGLNNAELEDLAADLRGSDLLLDALRLELGEDPDFLIGANLMVTFDGGANPGQSVSIEYNFGEGVTMEAFAVPEPSTLVLAALALLGCAATQRRPGYSQATERQRH